MKIARLFGFAAAGILAAAPQLRAQAIEFKGYTTGCFYFGAVCSPPIAPGTANDAGLQYVSAGFDGFTSLGGFLGIGTGGSVGSFGLFGLDPVTHDYTNEHFALRVFFMAPSATDVVFSGIMLGDVTFSSGGVNVSFGPPVTLPFTSGAYSGTFKLSIASVNLGPGQHAVPITGNIRAKVVATPEPASIALFATGLVGLIPMARRRNAVTA